MILGIGVDTTDIRRLEKILNRGGAFISRTFTERERKAAPPAGTPEERPAAPDISPESNISAFENITFKSEPEQAALGTKRKRAEYFAARFAAKEAVFKAVAHRMPAKTFDLRMIETLHEENGRPYVVTDGPFGEIMRQTGVTKVHISITTEGHYATAFAIAEGEDFI